MGCPLDSSVIKPELAISIVMYFTLTSRYRSAQLTESVDVEQVEAAISILPGYYCGPMLCERSITVAEILVFAPDKAEAAHYWRLLAAELVGTNIAVASTIEEAKPYISTIPILVGWKFPKDLIGQAKSLRWIHKVSAGVEDVVGATDRPVGLLLTRTGGAAIAPRMVEYVLAAIYTNTQQFLRAIKQGLNKQWSPYAIDLAAGKTVGVAGVGEIGTEIARALQKNGMRVLGWRRSDSKLAPGVDHVFHGRDELCEFVSSCDFVVSVLPATAETANVFDAHVFAAMRSGAVFINVGRGTTVDETALAEAISRHHVAAAVLDVFVDEPLPPTSPLWGLERVIVTPHVSGPIIPEDVISFFVENFGRFQSGERLLKEVDFDRGY